jgi:hypothetical protein
MEMQTFTGSFKDADAQALAVVVFKDERADGGLLQELDAACSNRLSKLKN